jgi:hypothetical protein
MGHRRKALKINEYMKYPVKLSQLSSSLEYYEEVLANAAQAQQYLSEHRWCKQIRNGWIFTNLGHPLCIFVFDVENLQSPEDNLLWVMTGDFPPLYLDTYNVKSTTEVVGIYVRLASKWIEAAEQQLPLDNFYPFDVPRNPEMVALFKQKVDFMREQISVHIDEVSVKAIQPV